MNDVLVFNERGQLIGLAFEEEATEPREERTFFDDRGRLIASVTVQTSTR